jgi:hypothetical protein
VKRKRLSLSSNRRTGCRCILPAPTINDHQDFLGGLMTATVPLGHFIWYELLTTDPAGAAAFYPAVLGWSAQEWQPAPDAPPYTLFTDGTNPLSGMMALPEEAAGAPPHWLVYVSTPDTDATLARATNLGATVLAPPMDVPEIGRMAVLADPQGAAFAIFTPQAAGPEPPAVPPVGHVSWLELAANEREAAFRFYHELFEWQKGDAFDMGPAGTYQLFGHGEAPTGGVFDRPPEVPAPNWMVYIRVANLEGALARVTAHNGQVLNGPMEVPGGDRVAQCLDPQGAAFALHSTAAA